MRRKVETVGVFVNQPLDEIADRVDILGLTHVQLHGDEGPSFCSAVAQRTGAKVIKAARIGHAADLRDLERFHTDFHLLDTAQGRAVRRHRGDLGLELAAQPPQQDPADPVGRADGGQRRRRRSRPCKPYAVDVASGVEAAPGMKDFEKLAAFFAAVEPAHVA